MDAGNWSSSVETPSYFVSELELQRMLSRLPLHERVALSRANEEQKRAFPRKRKCALPGCRKILGTHNMSGLCKRHNRPCYAAKITVP